MGSERAKAHAKRPYHCSCGKVVFGNGARAGHFAMHKRRADGHCRVGSEHWRREGYAPYCVVCGRLAEVFAGPRGMRCLAHKEVDVPLADITSDGVTVWVNGAGGLLGRFGRNGVDIHRPLSEQEEKGECLLCTHEPTTLADWEMFVQQMLEHFGVSVHYETYMPDRFRSVARNA
jgi:hypothetical protein